MNKKILFHSFVLRQICFIRNKAALNGALTMIEVDFMAKVFIYTDGSCSKNPGPGGYGAILVSGGREKIISGGACETTNNRMELKIGRAHV